MPIYLGNTELSAVYLGNISLQKILVGSNTTSLISSPSFDYTDGVSLYIQIYERYFSQPYYDFWGNLRFRIYRQYDYRIYMTFGYYANQVAAATGQSPTALYVDRSGTPTLTGGNYTGALNYSNNYINVSLGVTAATQTGTSSTYFSSYTLTSSTLTDPQNQTLLSVLEIRNSSTQEVLYDFINP